MKLDPDNIGKMIFKFHLLFFLPLLFVCAVGFVAAMIFNYIVYGTIFVPQ